jgi:hypothetical protein
LASFAAIVGVAAAGGGPETGGTFEAAAVEEATAELALLGFLSWADEPAALTAAAVTGGPSLPGGVPIE